MEISQIRYFLEVAESQHMTESAARLHIAQPALSQSIRRLEVSLGVPLFAHKGRNIVLTDYGKFLQSRLTPIMKELDELPELLATMARLGGETIHLNVLAASSLLTDAIIEYKNTHKALNFQLLQNTQSDFFDIEITTKMFYNEKPAKNRFVCSEKIYLAVPKNEKFSKKTSVSLSDVADEDFISLMGSKQFRYICDKFCRHAGINPKIIFESDNPTAVKNMIAANLGVGFWPEFTWGSLDSDDVLLLDINDPVCSRAIVITYNQNKDDTSNVEHFFEFLKDYFIRKKALAKEGSC